MGVRPGWRFLAFWWPVGRIRDVGRSITIGRSVCGSMGVLGGFVGIFLDLAFLEVS